MTQEQFTVRLFAEDEWEIFRAMRLHSLKTEPQAFSRTYEYEAKFAPDLWREDLRNKREGYFGLFDRDALIGITAIFPDKDDPSGETAKLGLSYILPEYRGRGLSQLLYKARIAWVMERSDYHTLKVSHRRHNEISRRANQHFGFMYKETKFAVSQPDGVLEDELHYEVNLKERRKMLSEISCKPAYAGSAEPKSS